MLGDAAMTNAQADEEEDEEAERAWEAATSGFEAPEGSKATAEGEVKKENTAKAQEDEYEDAQEAQEEDAPTQKRWEEENDECGTEKNGHADASEDEEEGYEEDEADDDEDEYDEDEAIKGGVYDEEEDIRTVALWEAATRGFEVRTKGKDSNEFMLKIKMSQMQPRFNLRTMKLYCGWLDTKFDQLRKQYGQDALHRCRAVVDFSQNKLTDDMTQELLRPFEEKDVSIGLLKLHKNRLSSEGVAHVCSYMLRETNADPPLEIHLSHNLIDDEGASCMLKTVRQLHEKGIYPPLRQDHAQEQAAVPVWIRMEQNVVMDPDTVIENARDEGVTTCLARDRNYCGPSKCWKTRTPLVHLYMFMVQADNDGYGGRQEGKGKGKRKGKDSQGKPGKDKANRNANNSGMKKESQTPKGEREFGKGKDMYKGKEGGKDMYKGKDGGKDMYKGKDGAGGKKGKDGYGNSRDGYSQRSYSREAHRYGKDSYEDGYGKERYGKGKDEYLGKGKSKGKDDHYGREKGDYSKGKGGGKGRWLDQPPLHQPPARQPQTPRQYLENPNRGKGGSRRNADYDWEDQHWSSNNRGDWGDSWHGGEWHGQSW